MAQGPKEVPSIPSVKSSDVCYNLLSLSVRQKPPRISEKLGTSVFRWQPFFFLYFYFSFFRSFSSFFLLFSFLFLLCLFTLRPLLIFIVFLSATYPEGGGCVFSPDIHLTYETTRFDNPCRYRSYIVAFTGECHYVWQYELRNGFFTEQKTEHKYRFCLHGPLTTHAFRRHWGWTEFGRETWLDLMVETQDVYKLRFNVVTSSNSTEATHFPNRLRFLPTKLYELEGSDECTWPLCYDCKRKG